MNISIITVTYNSASVINHCLKSIANQSYKNVEQIIIDGASSDGTVDIVNLYAKNISVLISEPDEGMYHAINKGLSLAKGEIIGILNSDDFYNHSEVLSKVIKIFEQDSSLDACYADLLYVGRKDVSQIVRYWKSNQFCPGSFSLGWCIPYPTLFVRRSVYEKYGNFNLNYRIAADVDLTIRFLEKHKIRVRHVPEIWVNMRVGGISNKNLRNIFFQNLEILRALKSYGLKANLIHFFINKIFSRVKQFLNRPANL
jgi:glycosyltransferase involved in cell wall biosynthesis